MLFYVNIEKILYLDEILTKNIKTCNKEKLKLPHKGK